MSARPDAGTEQSLEAIIGDLLKARGQTLALAESCTGGYVSHRITRIAGSSAYFIGSAVTYANDLKVRLLGVRPETLESAGAVSRETAVEMAEGVRRTCRSTYGVAVTGIAGPTGGSADKPVGTVWIAVAGPAGTSARRFAFHGERERIIADASQAALESLHRALEGAVGVEAR